jgi:hypothetical protein
MQHQLLSRRQWSWFVALSFGFALLLGTAPARAADEAVLFNGKDLAGWKFRNDKYPETWKVVSEVKLVQDNPKLLAGSGAGATADAVLFRQPVEHGSDLYTEKEFGDCELHLEFMVPKGSNSGVYLMGNYEIQVLDSFGKPDAQLGMGDCGSIYSAAVASSNATKAPGEWQSFDILFRAPRFDGNKKTENAKFVSVKLNGKEIHANVEVKGPTGGQLSGEKTTGPLLLQGDHGIVAFRNLRIKAVQIK